MRTQGSLTTLPSTYTLIFETSEEYFKTTKIHGILINWLLFFIWQDTFKSTSPFWTDRNTFNLDGGKTGFDFEETKLATYWRTNFTKICLGTKFQNQNRFIVINKTANSLFSLIADGIHRPTSLGRDTWKKLFGDSASLEPYCDSEGFNPACARSLPIRIGIYANDGNVCSECGTFIAFGSYYSGCFNSGVWVQRSGLQWAQYAYPAMGYIMVK